MDSPGKYGPVRWDKWSHFSAGVRLVTAEATE